MSKEQTPIKDLDYYKSNAEEDYITTPISVLRYISELENNAQAKVLEALEREVPKAFKTGAEENFVCMCYDADQRNFNENTYFETQVKPKYQNKDE